MGGYEDELVKSTCCICKRPVAIVPGRGWRHWDYEGIGFGEHYYVCPKCGPFASQYTRFTCPWCGGPLHHHHEAEGIWPPPRQRSGR